MNVIFITSDHHRWDYMGCAGCEIPTPNLDALAAGGCMLENAYCQSPLCMPSRTAMTLGRYAANTGVYANRNAPDPAAPTFLHSLRAADIHTGMMGKLHHHVHCMDHDYNKHEGDVHRWGFNEVREVSGKRGAGAVHCECRYTAFLRKVGIFDEFREKSGRFGETTFQSGITDPWEWDPDYTQDAFIRDLGIEFLREQPSKRPFFLHLGFVGPHPPFDAPPVFREGLPDTPSNVKVNPDWWPAYAACIREIDQHVGSIVQTLEELGQRENTMIIYTSDHGDMAGDHDKWGKVLLYEGSVHVPFIVNGPGIPAGWRSDALVELIDIGSTVCDLFGVESHELDQGKSLLPLLKGQTDRHRDSAYCEMGSDKMLFDGRYKLLWGDLLQDTRDHWQNPPHNGPAFGRPVNLSPDRIALYDLEKDPKELNNLAYDPEHKDLLNEMITKLLNRLIENSQSSRMNPQSVM
jgi:choline-sulfatase